MEWLTPGTLVFYAAGMTGLSVIGWLTWTLVTSRSSAHAREVISFFNSEYESVFYSRDMLVALFKEDFSGAAVTIKSGSSNNMIARLRYLSRMGDNNIQLEVRDLAYPLNIDSMPTTRLSVLLEDGRYICEYTLADKHNKKSLFSVNKNTVFETECAAHQIVTEGKYPVLQNGQIVGYIYSESNILGHYAVILLLKSDLPESVKALFLALEARRFGFSLRRYGWNW